ncbi:hypothetical protein HZB02_02165 [Candidatus Woesearchaeota archaeon]|nr:hypothetical protein [Candidatus Woesearchaeota archaeon]
MRSLLIIFVVLISLFIVGCSTVPNLSEDDRIACSECLRVVNDMSRQCSTQQMGVPVFQQTDPCTDIFTAYASCGGDVYGQAWSYLEQEGFSQQKCEEILQ